MDVNLMETEKHGNIHNVHTNGSSLEITMLYLWSTKMMFMNGMASWLHRWQYAVDDFNQSTNEARDIAIKINGLFVVCHQTFAVSVATKHTQKHFRSI